MLREHRKLVVTVLEIRDVDGNPNAGVLWEWPRQSVPEILDPELARVVRQGRVKNQPQCVNEVRLPYLVFTNNHCRTTYRDVQFVEVTEILDQDVCNPHVLHLPCRDDLLLRNPHAAGLNDG